jgi:membrane-associated phospholipid phosphatase
MGTTIWLRLLRIPLLTFVMPFALSLAVSPRVHADPSTPRYHQLENTTPLFLGVELGVSLALAGGYYLASGGPEHACGWCETNGFDRSVRRALVWNDRQTPALVSHVLSTGVAPVAALAAVWLPALQSRSARESLEDTLIMTSSMVTVMGLVVGTKNIAARQRPAFRYGVAHDTEYEHSPDQEFVSFFSGDTAFPFVLVASASTLGFLRGYSSAPYVAIGGGLIALTTALLRIGADMHWATDVLTGALVGTGIGIAVPLLLHGRLRADTASTQPALSFQAGFEPSIGITGAW